MKQCFFICLFLVPIFGFSQRNIKSELEAQLLELHYSRNRIADYDRLLREYNRIGAGINGLYERAAKKVAAGYKLVKGERFVRKHRNIEEGIRAYENEALTLYEEIGKAIDQARFFTKYRNKYSDFKGLPTILNALVPFLNLLEELACKDAANFYQEFRWLTASEVIKRKPEAVNWEMILGNRCTGVLKAEGY